MIELLTIISALLAWLLTANTFANLRFLIRPTKTDPFAGSVEVLIPARNEASTITQCVQSVLTQQGLSNLRVTVLSDASTDDTVKMLNGFDDARLNIIDAHDEPPAGWLGKPWACHRLAQQSNAQYLVFLDADVQLQPHAVVAALHALSEHDLQLVCPYPKQETSGILGRFIQPLLQWSWMTTVPLRSVRTTRRSSLAVANGQFLVCRKTDYTIAGGHESVQSDVLDDIALLRSFYASGLKGTVMDGTNLATCRMYDTDQDLVSGYAKSLWRAFGGPIGSLLTLSFLFITYTWPLFALGTNQWLVALIALIGGVLGRTLVAVRTKQRVVPDVFGHSISIALFIWLNAVSWWRHLRKRNQWKGRMLQAIE